MTKKTRKTTYFIFNFSIVIVCIVIAIISIICARRVAIEKSESGYEYLSSQRDVIEDDFNKVYSYDNYTITSSETGYNVTLAYRDYDGIVMICSFDSNFKYIDSTYVGPVIIENYLKLIIIFVVMGCIASAVIIWASKRLFD